MKILSYNIHRCNQEKIDSILQRGADIMVLPECAYQEQVTLPDGYAMTWHGDDATKWKGLGVIWRRTVDCRVADWYDASHKYMIPLIVDGKWLLLASWPTIVPGIKKTYPQILLECLKAYSEHIKEMPTMITGDFNCYIGQGGVSKQTGTFEQCIEYMQELGLRSEYHERTHEEFGNETSCTYHHQFKDDMPFFIDFTFTNIPLFAYMIGGWERNMSDHNPQIIVI